MDGETEEVGMEMVKCFAQGVLFYLLLKKIFFCCPSQWIK